MAENSSIEWTDTTWNVTAGCTRASPGCDNCYAVKMTKRLDAMGQAKYSGLVGKGHFNGVLRLSDADLAKPLKWRKSRKVFVNSMSDLFHRDVPFEFIDRVFAVMALTPQHTYQVLTKRPERMAEYLNRAAAPDNIANQTAYFIPDKDWRNPLHKHGPTAAAIYEGLDGRWRWPLLNVWLGTSVEDQRRADERIRHLHACPAEVRFLSCEPLLEFVNIHEFLFPDAHGYIDPDAPFDHDNHPERKWVIVGGESDVGARPFNVSWARSLRDQCREAGVPCFIKQLGSYTNGLDPAALAVIKDGKGGAPSEWPGDLRVREFPERKAVS